MRDRLISTLLGILGVVLGLLMTGFGLHPTLLLFLVGARFLATLHLQSTYSFFAMRRLSLDILSIALLLQVADPNVKNIALLLIMGFPPFNTDLAKCHAQSVLRPLIWTYLLPALPFTPWLAFVPLASLFFEQDKIRQAPRIIFLCLCLGMLSQSITYFILLIWVIVDFDSLPNGFEKVMAKGFRALLWIPHGLFRAGEIILVEGPIYGLLFIISGKKVGGD